MQATCNLRNLLSGAGVVANHVFKGLPMALAFAGVVSAIGFLLALSARRAIPHEPVMLSVAVLLQAAWIVPYARAFYRNWRRTVRSTAELAGIAAVFIGTFFYASWTRSVAPHPFAPGNMSTLDRIGLLPMQAALVIVMVCVALGCGALGFMALRVMCARGAAARAAKTGS